MLKSYRLTSANSSRSKQRYRWVIVWLSIGCMLAILLLANAVRDYVFVSRILATQQVRHQMTQLSAQVEQQLRRNEVASDTLKTALMGTALAGASIDLRTTEGVLIEHFGTTMPVSSFSVADEHRAFSRREPLYRTVSSSNGDLIVEVFPLHTARRPALDPLGTTVPGFLLLQIALPLKDAEATVLTPIRRNLIINLAAALALLSTVVLGGLGLRSYVRGRRLEEQIEIARQVQSRLLPAQELTLPFIQMSTEYRPSGQVGGDFYDLFPSATNGIAAVIGDVSGKGVPAALLMGVIHGAVRTANWQGAAKGHEDESGKLNLLLVDHASRNRFASMFWCVYDQPLQSLRYVNAGHCPPFLMSRRNGELGTQRLHEGGPVLGLLPDATYTSTTVHVTPGDLLVMFSDGLVEANNETGEEYGDARLAALLHAKMDETPSELHQTILQSLDAFSPRSEAQDDLTFTIIRF